MAASRILATCRAARGARRAHGAAAVLFALQRGTRWGGLVPVVFTCRRWRGDAWPAGTGEEAVCGRASEAVYLWLHATRQPGVDAETDCRLRRRVSCVCARSGDLHVHSPSMDHACLTLAWCRVNLHLSNSINKLHPGRHTTRPKLAKAT